MNAKPLAFSRYLPVEPDAQTWGLHVLDVGHASIPPDSPYPPGKHPRSHLFTWEKGRLLDEFQVVYLSRGEGEFDSRATGRVPVREGDAMLLFPGVWHRYRPNRSTGWDEQWVGFDGQQARRIMRALFSPKQPVLRIGPQADLLGLMRSVGEALASPVPGYAQIMAARAMEMLALLRSLMLAQQQEYSRTREQIERARCILLDHAEESIALDALAREVGMSYSAFRRSFARHAGTSPRSYQLEIRINKAKELLRGGTFSVSEIAERLGFTSVYYFSRLFKRRTGRAPSEWRGSQRRGSQET